jgi:hypothetical protein
MRVSKKIRQRAKTALALCLWIGSVMFGFSVIVAVLLGRDFLAFYFTESFMFYNIMMVLVVIFVFGLLFSGEKSESAD